ncbi:HNH endonuclease [Algoriphagus formosus]|uniref:HNH endonuclease n=1 Tax=Algoriphagus formosus TaxID=2007308 RepID=UPI0018E21521|nr:HNH endonuclease [Algoriphagus formosus]
MKLIQSYENLKENLQTLEYYLFEGTDEEFEFSAGLIKRGKCFFAYKVEDQYFFAPSRFVGYSNNSKKKHLNNSLHGGKTNLAINRILGYAPKPNKKLEKMYLEYCSKINIEPNKTGSHGNQRKFWDTNLELHEVAYLQKFEEGQLSLRTHLIRERNPKVVKLAKENFLKKYGKLFCEACGFDFYKVYGDLGKNFIEGHHIEPLSKRTKNKNTNPEDIALLCSNCHRMVHRLPHPIPKSDLTSILIK